MFSKTKTENIFCLGFNLVNLSLYITTVSASMMRLVVEHGDVSQILTCIYAFLLCFGLFIVEIKPFDMTHDYFKFLTFYRGKSIMLLLLGSIIISTSHTFILVAGILDLSFGLIYMILSFISSFPLPRPITENWQNWQDYSAEGLDLHRPDKEKDDSATRLKLSMLNVPQHGKVSPV